MKSSEGGADRVGRTEGVVAGVVHSEVCCKKGFIGGVLEGLGLAKGVLKGIFLPKGVFSREVVIRPFQSRNPSERVVVRELLVIGVLG